MRKIILVNVLLITVGLVVLELMFGTWFQETAALYHFTKPRNLTIHRKSVLPGQPEIITYARDSYGFRGLDGPLEDIFVITVGGSTTDQRHLDESATYSARLEELFREGGRPIDIVNAGVDGQSTFGHLDNFKFWFGHVPRLKPKFILFYIGINDFFDTDARPWYDAVTTETRLAFHNRLIQFLKDKSAIHAMYVIIKSIVKPPKLAHATKYVPWVYDLGNTTEVAYVTDFGTPGVLKSLNSLKFRVRRLAELTRKIGARPIFVTQRSVYWVRLGGQIRGVPSFTPGQFSKALKGFAKLSGVDRYNLERLQARAIMESCRGAKAICLDLAAETTFDTGRDMIDMVHTTPSGSQIVARWLYRKLAPIAAVP